MEHDALELSLVNDLRELARAAAQVEAFCAARGLAPKIAYTVNLAIDEIVTNTISYGYDDDDTHRIEIALRLDGETLSVTIVDDGRAFDPSPTRRPDIDAPLEDRKVGGLGLFFVQQTMDGLEYRRRNGRNVVTLTKNTATEAP